MLTNDAASTSQSGAHEPAAAAAASICARRFDIPALPAGASCTHSGGGGRGWGDGEARAAGEVGSSGWSCYQVDSKKENVVAASGAQGGRCG